MAVSQSLTSIMEEMVTKVMEDAVSTSIIFTQVPVKEVSNEGDQEGHEVLPSCSAAGVPHQFYFDNFVPLDTASPACQPRRRLFHMPSAGPQEVTRTEEEEEEELANEMILEEQEAVALREAEAEIAYAKNIGEMVAKMMVEELLLHVVGEKAGVNVSSDFFSQSSPPGPQHPPPCSQDFAFFKSIEQTREDVTLESEESQEQGLSPPSQYLCSPSTSELGDLMRSRTRPSDHCPCLSLPETSRSPPASRYLHQAPSEKRRNAFVATELNNRPCPLTPNCSLFTQQQESQEDLFSSQEEEPEQKRRKTLQSCEEAEVQFEGGVENEHLDDEDVGVENNDWDKSSDEGDALPLTFHTKDDILRKLQDMQHANRGAGDCNDDALKRSSSKICPGGAEEQLAVKAKKCREMNMDDDSRSSVERSRRVAMDKEGHMNNSPGNGVDKLTVVAMEKAFGIGDKKSRGMDKRLNRDVEKMSSSTGIQEEFKQEVKVEAVAEAGDPRKVIIAAADEERTEEEICSEEERGDEYCRQDSYEDISTVVGQYKQDDPGKETDVMTRLHQPLLLHRAPRLGLSRLQKPSGIHDITIIKDISFNEGYQSDGEVSFIKEE